MAIKRQSDIERVLGKYMRDAVTGCLNFTGRLDKDGYACRVKVGSRTDGSRREIRPHRWLYEQRHGKLPAILVPDHLCRNRRCGEVTHLEAVTKLVNHHRGLRALATHCPNGHQIAGENEILRVGGGHRCRVCFNERMAEYQRCAGHKHAKAYRNRLKESENR